MSRRPAGDKRQLDWSGIVDDVLVLGTGVVNSTNLWTPVTEMETATVTRIRGVVNPALGADITQAEGSYDFELFGGIQVVNRAAGAVGTARDPSLNDDMEGREWLWLRMWTLSWVVQGAIAPTVTVVDGGDVLTGAYDPYVDVKAQRKLDLSQDELLLSFAGQGTPTTLSCLVHVQMRLLLKY